ncbi:MAG: hypothetical protein ABI878_01945 [Acidobacteriota bacterium]
MRVTRYLLLLVIAFSTSCDGCAKEIIKWAEAIGGLTYVHKRISGKQYLSFASGDSKDAYSSKNGYMCVVHNPGCGWFLSSGNNGGDKFFGDGKDLPPGVKVEGAYFHQYWPVGITADPGGNIFGTGSYGSEISGGGSYPYTVNWKNTCWQDYGGKNLNYTVSFIVSMPEGTDLGEETFDDGPSTSDSCLPENYVANKPTGSSPGSGYCGTLKHSDGYSLPLTLSSGSPITYSGTLAVTCSGKLTKITNPNLFAITIVSTNGSVALNSGASTSAADLNKLYGLDTPALPVVINVVPRIQIDPSRINDFSIIVAYDYYE